MRRTAMAATAVAVAVALTGCGGGYDEATEASLRQRVVEVSAASAAGDWQGALAKLDAMVAELSQARADGKVDDERYESIVAAMDLVRQDLDAAITAAADAAEQQRLMEEQARLQEQINQLQSEQPEEESGDDGGKDGNKGGKGKKDD